VKRDEKDIYVKPKWDKRERINGKKWNDVREKGIK
jgi:hypothetical protein